MSADKNLDACKQAAQKLVEVAAKNDQIRAEYERDLAQWQNEYAQWEALQGQFQRHEGQWGVYPINKPGDYWTGCSSDTDGDRVCQTSASPQYIFGITRPGQPGLPKFWHAFDSNCEGCAKASLACTGAFGFQRAWSRGCTFDLASSNREYVTTEPKKPRPRPVPQFLPLDASMICQDCRNSVTTVGNQDAKVALNQMATCIANIQSGKADAAAKESKDSKDSKNINNSSLVMRSDQGQSFFQQNQTAFIALGVLCLCIIIVVIIVVL